jgi:prolyl 4-hydroxylase
MGMRVNFSSELRAWILHNLDRGCAADDLISNMIAQKFEPGIARGLVEAFKRARNGGIDPPAESVVLDLPQPTYRYETPRLAHGSIIRTTDREIPVVLRLEQPVVAILKGVLSDDECARLIDTARDRLRPSTVVDPSTGEDKIASHRNSEGIFFQLQETPFIASLDQRISELMNSPLENGEGLQILRYRSGAKSDPHFDFLAPSNAANRESIARSGQRISSLVIYLNDVANGGETVFPEIGLSVSAHRGNAVYFEYTNSMHQVDYRSAHAGAMVITGEKWVATKWMRERRFKSSTLTKRPQTNTIEE